MTQRPAMHSTLFTSTPRTLHFSSVHAASQPGGLTLFGTAMHEQQSWKPLQSLAWTHSGPGLAPPLPPAPLLPPEPLMPPPPLAPLLPLVPPLPLAPLLPLAPPLPLAPLLPPPVAPLPALPPVLPPSSELPPQPADRAIEAARVVIEIKKVRMAMPSRASV